MQVDSDSPILTPDRPARHRRTTPHQPHTLTAARSKKAKSKASHCGRVFRRTSDPTELAALASNWRRAVLENPKAYLAHRYRVYSEVAGFTRRPAKLLYLGPRGVAKNYPLPASTQAMLKWFLTLKGTLWFRVWLYVSLQAVALCAALVFYLRTRNPADVLALRAHLALSLFLAA